MKHCHKIHYVVVIVLAALLFSRKVQASPLGITSDNLHLLLTKDTASIDGTRDSVNSSTEQATVQFQLKWDVTEDSLNFIKAEILFDQNSLIFLNASSDTVNWPSRGAFIVTDSSVIGKIKLATLLCPPPMTGSV